MKNKAFTLLEILVAVTLLSMVIAIFTNIFFSGSRAYRKEIRNFTILDRGRFVFIKMRNDVRNANSIIFPPDDGKEYSRLVVLKHKLDFLKKPEDTSGYADSSINFKNHKIEYFLEDHTDEKDKEVYRDLKILKRKEYRAKDNVVNGNLQYEEISENIISHNVETMTFLRKKLEVSGPADEITPEEGGIAPENVRIEIYFKSYREEDYGISLDNIERFFSVRFSTYISSRGSFIGGTI
jgi:prepilin-type N-terminal cleavage/methylation domain-containing protein